MIKPFYILFVDTKVQDTLGSEEFGIYFGVFNFTYILHIITDLGIQNFSSKTIAQNNSLIKIYLPNILGVKLVLTGVFLTIGSLLAYVVGYDYNRFVLFLFLGINLALLSFILYLRSNISALGKYRWDSVVSILDKLLLIFVLSYFLFQQNDNFTIYHYVFAQTFSFVVVLAIVLGINIKLSNVKSINFSFDFAKKLLKDSFPYSIVFVLMTLYMKMDGFMLERMLPSSIESGKYAASFRLYEALNNIGYLFAVLLFPMFASLFKSREKLKELVEASHNLMLFIAVTAALIMIFYRSEILLYLYPNNYSDSYGDILVVLMVSFFAISLTYIYGTILSSGGKMLVFNTIVGIGVVINLILNFILIPTKGALGAGIATIFTQYFVLIGQYIYSHKYYKLGLKFNVFIKRLFFVLILIISLYLIRQNFDLNWIYKVAISGILSVVLAFMFGLLHLFDKNKYDA